MQQQHVNMWYPCAWCTVCMCGFHVYVGSRMGAHHDWIRCFRTESAGLVSLGAKGGIIISLLHSTWRHLLGKHVHVHA